MVNTHLIKWATITETVVAHNEQLSSGKSNIIMENFDKLRDQLVRYYPQCNVAQYIDNNRDVICNSDIIIKKFGNLLLSNKGHRVLAHFWKGEYYYRMHNENSTGNYVHVNSIAKLKKLFATDVLNNTADDVWVGYFLMYLTCK